MNRADAMSKPTEDPRTAVGANALFGTGGVGYYWDIGPQDCPFVGRWQYRFKNCGGGEPTKERAVESLRCVGATSFVEVTSEAGQQEFGLIESHG